MPAIKCYLNERLAERMNRVADLDVAASAVIHQDIIHQAGVHKLASRP